MLLDVKNLQVAYGKIKALHGIDFHINDGEIVTIIGANGAGKSSTLRAISRLVPSGADTEMTFSGKNLLKYPPEKVVSELGITHVPEGRRLFGNLTVLENLQLAAFARKDKDDIQRDIERVFAIFSRLEERKTQKSGTMSGGEQQMLAVGRAFVAGRRLMLLDEPSMGLSPLLMKRVFRSLKEINQTEGTAILLVEQNARLALKFAKRGYVLENGNMVLHGPSEDLLDNEDVKKAYLGG
jgi:branched-chain amino acid transport system ATP-binding protein